ncbi:MAG: hypothetical protein IPK16_27495 [Anaerolineales bacterium]|nr:hypothetical protein [Anaerolineales bacterium]
MDPKAKTDLGENSWPGGKWLTTSRLGWGMSKVGGRHLLYDLEGARGTIFRCHPRDPSLYNWPALRLAVIRKLQMAQADDRKQKGAAFWENILADFPIINKSFNLAYAANDG